MMSLYFSLLPPFLPPLLSSVEHAPLWTWIFGKVSSADFSSFRDAVLLCVRLDQCVCVTGGHGKLNREHSFFGLSQWKHSIFKSHPPPFTSSVSISFPSWPSKFFIFIPILVWKCELQLHLSGLHLSNFTVVNCYSEDCAAECWFLVTEENVVFGSWVVVASSWLL